MTTTADAVSRIADYLPRWLDAQLREYRLPGVQVAIRLDGELRLSLARGISSVVTGEELTTAHLFRVASHSKTFTATAIMQLREAGKLRLDDRLAEHVPAYVGTPVADVTVRELLGHRGGVLRDGIESDFWQLGGNFPDEDTLHALAAEHIKRYEPMQYWKYTNIGYAMLGEVVAAVSGQSWNDYVREHVIDALGLTSTTPDYEPERGDAFAGTHSRIVPRLGRRVAVDQAQTHAFASATGVCATAEDISAFMAAHRIGSGQLLSDGSKRYMQNVESVIMQNGEEAGRYGLGMFHWKIGDRRTVGHSGGWLGHITKTVLDPEDGLVVSVLTNAVDGQADAILRGVIGLIDLAKKDREAWQPEVDAAVLRTFEGRYECLWDVSDVLLLGDRLVQIWPAEPDPREASQELAFVSPTILRTKDQDENGGNGEDVVFVRDGAGTVTAMKATGVTSWPSETYEGWIGEHLKLWH